jgi:hypothetical protein
VPVGTWQTSRRDVRPRRHVLRLAAGAALAGGAAILSGCDLVRDDQPAPAPPPDPLLPLHAEALRLASAYDAALQAQPPLAGRLTGLATAHRAHAAELGRIIRPPAPADPAASGSAAPAPDGDSAAVLTALREAEQAGQRAAAAACRAAPADRAALLGSIAAARASHVEALRA